jgi:hypothetical protein
MSVTSKRALTSIILQLGPSAQHSEVCKKAASGLRESDAEPSPSCQGNQKGPGRSAKLLGITQPRIPDLMRCKIEPFGLNTLVNMIGTASLHVELRVSDAA